LVRLVGTGEFTLTGMLVGKRGPGMRGKGEFGTRGSRQNGRRIMVF
jgi:hypothetical protein